MPFCFYHLFDDDTVELILFVTTTGSFVWTRPSLHFVVYIPRESQMPLVIHSPDGTPLPTNRYVQYSTVIHGYTIHGVYGCEMYSWVQEFMVPSCKWKMLCFSQYHVPM